MWVESVVIESGISLLFHCRIERTKFGDRLGVGGGKAKSVN